MIALESKEILSAHGLLSTVIPGFNEREPQLQLTEAIEHALTTYQTLVAEAGTGTGKTFAYLVPALLSGKKIIISTGTKNLQDQLFYQDLPILLKSLKRPLKVALLKGRANYICLHRLEKAYTEGRLLSRQVAIDLQTIKTQLARVRTGEITDFGLAESAEIWDRVTSTADNCLGQECSFWSECYLVKARRKAQEAEIVVVNHHLFFADMALREEGFGELLPLAQGIILDEAHQLAEIASRFFGESLSSRQLLELAKDVQQLGLEFAKELKEVELFCHELIMAVQQMWAELARLTSGELPRRRPWHEVAQQANLAFMIAEVRRVLEKLLILLETQASRSDELANANKRTQDLLTRFVALTGLTPAKQIHWYEVFSKAFSLHFTPMDIAEPFQQLRQATKQAWIFTSATLAVNNNFQHFMSQLGISDAKTLLLPSPFNYQQQAVLYVPQYRVEPNQQNYVETLVEAAIPLLKASRGRAFMLFTSHATLQRAADLLAQRLDFPLLIQGQAPKLKLLERFKQLKQPILLGTASFWEGVDVKGEALSCVIIDRLPFASPDDPILQARIKALNDNGQNAFLEYQLPRAVLMLKQGAGRLIRDQADYGVLMIGDLRLIQRHYGKAFVASLPPMAKTRSLAKVLHFLESLTAKQR